MNEKTNPSIVVKGLSFAYENQQPLVLDTLDFQVPSTSRCLLVGANGAGKTTLLAILAGQYMIDPKVATVLGRSAFHDTSLASEISYLGGPFPFHSDIKVASMLQNNPEIDPKREKRLVEILEINPNWRMHQVSSGQRRRVQILLGLRRASKVFLLDEITTDLDVIGRSDLLQFLRKESEERGVTILYASHILDGLEEWATHLAFLDQGRIVFMSKLSEIPELQQLKQQNLSAPLLRVIERWLRKQSYPV